MLMDFKVAFRLINDRKEEKYAFLGTYKVLNQLLILQTQY